MSGARRLKLFLRGPTKVQLLVLIGLGVLEGLEMESVMALAPMACATALQNNLHFGRS